LVFRNGSRWRGAVLTQTDENGKTVIEKETHQEGGSGSSETHIKTETNPETGTTHSTTTTEHE
jgi:hypothetical protein